MSGETGGSSRVPPVRHAGGTAATGTHIMIVTSNSNDFRVTQLDRYTLALGDMPASGGGGCHAHLLTVANYGVSAGLCDDEIFRDVREHVHGTRHVFDKEIWDAIKKARMEQRQSFSSSTYSRPTQRPRIDGKNFLATLIEKGRDHDECDLWEASPVRIDWPRQHDHLEVLQRLYSPNDLLFVGGKEAGILGRSIRSTTEWIAYFKSGGHTVELFMPNPLTGIEGTTKSNTPSFRSDDCVKDFRIAVVEFDELSREDQLAFWWSVDLPVVALVDSGRKSIHGWVRVNCCDADEWTEQVERRLFGSYLIPMGVDGACRNESRLSRLPGHKRKSTGRWQRLLYLAPQGRRVAA